MPFYNQWNFGFNLNWELDFWGRFRRAIESDTANLDASVEGYDDVLVTLLGDVATNYVQMRTLEGRIQYTRANVELQRQTLTIAEARFKGGTTSKLDVYQARSTLEQTEAQIPELEISLRQTVVQLCILLGMPPEELRARLGPAPIPTAPVDVAVGIPADLLRRRPDVRRAERLAAAQCAQIGIAEADYYPAFSINGTLGYSAEQFPDLFRPAALNANVGPSFQWNLLNYGRILNNVRLQDARFQELVTTYQQTVLNANQEVENGLVTFLRAQTPHEFPDRQRGRCRKSGQDRAGPVRGGDDRFHPRHPVGAVPGPRAGRAHAGPRRNRHRPDSGLQGPRGRLADSADRLPADRFAAGRSEPGRRAEPRGRAPAGPDARAAGRQMMKDEC